MKVITLVFYLIKIFLFYIINMADQVKQNPPTQPP